MLRWAFISFWRRWWGRLTPFLTRFTGTIRHMPKSEIEVKISVPSVPAARKRIRDAGFRVHVPRVFEVNILWDTADLRLRAQGKLVRLRDAGGHSLLTF